MSRIAKLAVLLVIAAGGAAASYYWYAAREIAVRIVPVETGVEIRVFGIGNVEAQLVSKVGFQISGKLVETGVDQGDTIKAGSLLAKLEDSVQRAKLMKSEVAVQQAAANLAKAQAQRERANSVYQQKKTVNTRRQALLDRGTVAQEAADDTRAGEEIAGSELRVAEAEAAIATVLRDDAAAQRQIDLALLGQHELRAPFEARVIARLKELGSVVNPGEPVFTLIAAESIWVRAYVDEALAGGLQVGQTAFVRLRSEPDKAVEAKIVRIDEENDRVTEERRIYVRCSACSPKHQIRFLGEQAEVEIVKSIASGRFVPMKHVENFDGRAGTVWVIENGRLARRRVEFGDRLLDGRILITSRFPERLEVVADARKDLREGRAARPETSGR